MDWQARGAWSGLRPTTPDSLPILSRLSTPSSLSSSLGEEARVGGSKRGEGAEGGEGKEEEEEDNIYINAGHGTMGWTLSMGSADVLAAIALGQPQVGR